MKKNIIVPVLAILISALILFGVTAGLNGMRIEIAQKEHVSMMQTLLPGSTEFVRESYAGEDANIRSVHRGETGFVIETVTTGYTGEIWLMVGVSKAGSVTGLTVRQMGETHTLGAEALHDADFLAQFLNTSGEAEVGETVDAITGATVTSRAIARGVNSAVAFVTGADVSSEATTWEG